jgi:hypothetical protein
MKKPMTMKQAMKKYESSPEDMRKDKAGAKKLMKQAAKPPKKGKSGY